MLYIYVYNMKLDKFLSKTAAPDWLAQLGNITVLNGKSTEI